VRLWFWGWLIAAVAIAAVSAAFRDRFSAPFAAGAACAAALEAARIDPGAQWLAFAGISIAVSLAANRRRYRARHSIRASGRHGVRPAENDR